jgi:hypothetical protein
MRAGAVTDYTRVDITGWVLARRLAVKLSGVAVRKPELCSAGERGAGRVSTHLSYDDMLRVRTATGAAGDLTAYTRTT